VRQRRRNARSGKDRTRIEGRRECRDRVLRNALGNAGQRRGAGVHVLFEADCDVVELTRRAVMATL
jgi:hypothetical protein